jgi:beta-glucosidase-like glycosyl hydrolase
VKIYIILIGALFALSAMAADSPSIYHDGWIDLNKNGKMDVYEDPSQPIKKRVNDLLKRMTLQEKIGQLWQAHMDRDADTAMAQTIRASGVGSFLDGSSLIETPVMRNKLQHIAIEQSRLGIPLILGHDVIHGFRTSFPVPLAEACAWEPSLFERTQTIAAREAAAAGIDWTFAPMVDLARDPRWGRIIEGFGEDPYLGSLYGAANVRGFQGTNVADPDRVVACVKHYVGYGAAEGGRDYNTTEISRFTLRNFYLPQFKAGIDAGALTIMSAFNDLDGIPTSGNAFTLTEVLRDEWKFKGFVVSDYQSVSQMIDHGYAANEEEAARFALTAGVDMEMVSTTYVDTVAAQIKEKKISKSTLDEAVRRVLTVKFEKGLFDHPFVDETRYKTAYLQPDALALAREAAQKSCSSGRSGMPRKKWSAPGIPVRTAMKSSRSPGASGKSSGTMPPFPSCAVVPSLRLAGNAHISATTPKFSNTPPRAMKSPTPSRSPEVRTSSSWHWVNRLIGAAKTAAAAPSICPDASRNCSMPSPLRASPSSLSFSTAIPSRCRQFLPRPPPFWKPGFQEPKPATPLPTCSSATLTPRAG